MKHFIGSLEILVTFAKQSVILSCKLPRIPLTGAAETLFAQPQQHILTDVAVHRLVKMLHPPQVLAVSLSHLGKAEKHCVREQEANYLPSLNLCIARVLLYFTVHFQVSVL